MDTEKLSVEVHKEFAATVEEKFKRQEDENNRQNQRPSKYDGLKGRRFERLLVISDPVRIKGFSYYDCLCDCGTKKQIRADGLVSGFVKSCGCLIKEIVRQPKPEARKQNSYYIVDNVAYVSISGTEKKMICDADDWERLKNHCWLFGSDGYARTNLHTDDDLKFKKFHQAVMGTKQGYVVDHINRNRLDNRKSNLRFVTKQANSVNYNIAKNNTTGITGVYRRKDNGKWKATIFVSGKEIALGHYATKEEAAKARKRGEEKYFAPLFAE